MNDGFLYVLLAILWTLSLSGAYQIGWRRGASFVSKELKQQFLNWKPW